LRRPRFIAEQARDARGLLGRLIAFIMARETWAENLRAIEALNVQDGDHVLDVGCGHGRSLAALAARTPDGRVVGADPSELMAEIAVARNRRLIRRKRVAVTVAGVEALPFQDSTFDRALCVHVAYFWKDLDAALQEVGRVLRPGARLALILRTSRDAAAVSRFPAEVYRFRPLDEVLAALGAAGFDPDVVDHGREPALLVVRKTRSCKSFALQSHNAATKNHSQQDE
jgi:SAM-dependent methyltransferase